MIGRQRRRPLFEERFSSQLAPTKASSRARLGWYFLAMLGAVIIWLVFFSPYFAITKVNIEGLQRVNESQVRPHLQVQGQNIFRFRTATLVTALAAIPEIGEVHVVRRLPHTLAVVVIEREPVLFWQTTNVLYDVDQTGAVFRQEPVAATPADRLFVVIDTASVHVTVGQKVVPPAFITAFQKITRSLPTIYPNTLDHFEVGETVYDLDAVLKDGRRARFNILSNVESQLADLTRISVQRPDLFSRSMVDLRVDRWAFIH